MFPKLARLPRDSFNDIFRKARFSRGNFSVVHYSPSDSTAVAVVISKKIFKQAVKRHRYKRIVLGILHKRIMVSNNTTYNIIVRLVSSPTNETEFRADLEKQLAFLEQ